MGCVTLPDPGPTTQLNPESGAVENLEILFFSKRLTANEKIELPIEMDLRLVS